MELEERKDRRKLYCEKQQKRRKYCVAPLHVLFISLCTRILCIIIPPLLSPSALTSSRSKMLLHMMFIALLIVISSPRILAQSTFISLPESECGLMRDIKWNPVNGLIYLVCNEIIIVINGISYQFYITFNIL